MADYFVGALSTPATSPSIRAQVWKWAGRKAPPIMVRGTGWRVQPARSKDTVRRVDITHVLGGDPLDWSEFGILAETAAWHQYGTDWAATVSVITIGTDIVFNPTCAGGLPQPPGSPVWASHPINNPQLKFTIGGRKHGGLVGYISLAVSTDDCAAMVYFVRPAVALSGIQNVSNAAVFSNVYWKTPLPAVSVSDLLTTTMTHIPAAKPRTIQNLAKRAESTARAAAALLSGPLPLAGNTSAQVKLFEALSSAAEAHATVANANLLDETSATTHQAEIKQYRSAVDALVLNLNKSTTALGEVRSLVKEWKSACEDLDAQLKRVQAFLKTEKKTVATLRAKNAKLNGLLEDADDDNDDLAAQNKALETQLAKTSSADQQTILNQQNLISILESQVAMKKTPTKRPPTVRPKRQRSTPEGAVKQLQSLLDPTYSNAIDQYNTLSPTATAQPT